MEQAGEKSFKYPLQRAEPLPSSVVMRQSARIYEFLAYTTSFFRAVKNVNVRSRRGRGMHRVGGEPRPRPAAPSAPSAPRNGAPPVRRTGCPPSGTSFAGRAVFLLDLSGCDRSNKSEKKKNRILVENFRRQDSLCEKRDRGKDRDVYEALPSVYRGADAEGGRHGPGRGCGRMVRSVTSRARMGGSGSRGGA